MPTTALGPQGPNYTLIRPIADTQVSGGADTWCKDCSTQGATDGTYLTADFFNAIIDQLRTAIRTAGITLDNTNSLMLYQAMQKVVTDHGYVQKSGDSMSGALTLHGDPSNALHAAPKQYVDASKASLLDATGRIKTSLLPGGDVVQVRSASAAAMSNASATKCSLVEYHGPDFNIFSQNITIVNPGTYLLITTATVTFTTGGASNVSTSAYAWINGSATCLSSDTSGYPGGVGDAVNQMCGALIAPLGAGDTISLGGFAGLQSFSSANVGVVAYLARIA